MMDTSTAVKQYQEYFESLTDETVERIKGLAVRDVRYRGPLLDAQGIDAVIACLHGWFRDLSDVKFEFGDHAASGQLVFQYWSMRFRIRKTPRKLWHIDGVSRVVFDEDGRMRDLVDYWDTGPLLAGFPLLGHVVRLIKKLM